MLGARGLEVDPLVATPVVVAAAFVIDAVAVIPMDVRATHDSADGGAAQSPNRTGHDSAGSGADGRAARRTGKGGSRSAGDDADRGNSENELAHGSVLSFVSAATEP